MEGINSEGNKYFLYQTNLMYSTFLFLDGIAFLHFPFLGKLFILSLIRSRLPDLALNDLLQLLASFVKRFSRNSFRFFDKSESFCNKTRKSVIIRLHKSYQLFHLSTVRRPLQQRNCAAKHLTWNIFLLLLSYEQVSSFFFPLMFPLLRLCLMNHI